MIGIYRIKNLINNKSYYGSSKEIEKRWKRHKNELNKNKHINILLQRAWNKYGEENFIFEIVEECDINILLEVEQKYLDLEPEYNIGTKSSGGDNITKNPKRNDIVKNIKNKSNEWLSSLTDEERKKKFSKPMQENSNWKGGKSYIYCSCGKRIGYGNKTCIECKDISGVNNPFYGKKHTEETKRKLKEKREGTYNGSQNLSILIDNVEYRSAGEASKLLNIPMVTIRWRVLSKNKKFENYKYKN